MAALLALLPPAAARAQEKQGSLVLASSAPPAPAATDLELALAPDVRRARRTARAGGFLMGIGALGTLAGAVAWARLDDQECAADDPFCLDLFPRGMGALAGMVAGAGVFTVGLVTLSVGIGKRNGLEGAAASFALDLGPGSLGARLRF